MRRSEQVGVDWVDWTGRPTRQEGRRDSSVEFRRSDTGNVVMAEEWEMSRRARLRLGVNEILGTVGRTRVERTEKERNVPSIHDCAAIWIGVCSCDAAKRLGESDRMRCGIVSSRHLLPCLSRNSFLLSGPDAAEHVVHRGSLRRPSKLLRWITNRWGGGQAAAAMPFFFFCSTFSKRARLMCGRTPPKAIVARMRVSSSSSPRMASCR